ncbi:MAG: BON domain-containing protein [Gaiella sp.]
MSDLTSGKCDAAGRQARRLGTLTVGAALGATIAYLFDTASGRRRRHEARDRMVSLSRRHFKSAVGCTRNVARSTSGKIRGRVLNRIHGAGEFDDAELAHKVSTEIFRDGSLPKGRLSLNAENGRVCIRGEVDSPSMIEAVTEAVRRVSGVREVENLMHLPGTPAPHPESGVLLHR